MSLYDAITRIARIVHGNKQQPRGLYTPAPPRLELPPPPFTQAVYHGGGPLQGGRPSDAYLRNPRVGAQQLPGHYWSESRPAGVSYAELGGADPWIARANGDRAEAVRLFNQYADERGLGAKMRSSVYDSIMSPTKPRLYGADLQVDPARLMAFDEPVRAQPEAVRQALERMGAVRGPGDLERTAGEVYQALGEEQGPLKTATRLGAEGIPHLTYRDPGHRALGVESAPNYVIPPGWIDRVLSDPRAYGVAGGGAVMGALAAPEPAEAAPTTPPQPMGSLASPLRLRADAPDFAGDGASPATARGRLPLPMTGMTNRNTLMNPDDPIAQIGANIAQRYIDYVKTPGDLLRGDPRFTVHPQTPGVWSEYDEENALRTGHELARRAAVTALDATTGGFPKAITAAAGAARGEQFLGAGGGRIVIPRRQEGLGGSSARAPVMGSIAEMPAVGAQPPAAGLISGRYVNDPQRVAFPGVYKDPRVLAQEGAANVAPEHPALKKLFGVSREDLYDIGQQGTRQGNVEPQFWQPAKGRGSYAANAIMTPQNAQRMVDALAEAERFPQLTHSMDAWYVMDPAFQRMVQLVGREQAIKDYTRFNMTTAPFSAGSNVMTELNRGTAANMFAARGDYPTFAKYGGVKEGARGPDFPPELADVKGHAYHGVQSDPVARFLATGEHGYAPDTVKIPAYSLASGVPETGFQTRWPVADAHTARSSGMADVRQSKDFADYMGGSEYRGFGPWYRENVAAPLGIEAVPAQARQWGLYAPQTNVDTAVGAPKLELLSQSIWERAQRLGIDPYKLRDDVLTGKDHATWLLPGAGLGVGAIAAQDSYPANAGPLKLRVGPDSYQLPPLDVEEEQRTGGP